MVTGQMTDNAGDDVIVLIQASGMTADHQKIAAGLAVDFIRDSVRIRAMLMMVGLSEVNASRVIEGAFAVALRTETGAREQLSRRANT